MKDLLDSWSVVARKIKGRHLLLLLDFDGTVTRLRNHPEKVVLTKPAQAILRTLAGNPAVTLGFISGRDLENLAQKLRLKNIIYSGNHGSRITGRGLEFTAKIPKQTGKAMEDFYRELAAGAKGIRGAMIEKKAFTIGLHYWHVKPAARPALLDFFHALLRKYSRYGIYAKPGKNIVEACPPSAWHKGDAVNYILKHTARLRKGETVYPVYIGDDVTDEDAFRFLRGKGLSVKVGPGKSSAQYRLKDPREVARALLLFSHSTRG